MGKTIEEAALARAFKSCTMQSDPITQFVKGARFGADLVCKWRKIEKNLKGDIANETLKKFSAELVNDNIIIIWDNFYGEIEVIKDLDELGFYSVHHGIQCGNDYTHYLVITNPRLNDE